MLRAQFRTKAREYWLLDSMPTKSLMRQSTRLLKSLTTRRSNISGIPKQISHPKMGMSNLVGSPINLSDTPPKFFRAAPFLGEHTEQVLANLGYDIDAVKELRASGVI